MSDQQHASTHQHEGADPGAIHFTQEFWDDRYGSADAIWSGRPNAQLVSTVTGLPAGSALDVGCGEGADAIWLAGLGWRVLGVDVSSVALGRSARQAATVGGEVAARIAWQQVDALSWQPEPASFDLVSAQFMYLAPDDLARLHRRLAAAVRPGGLLLIVGHHPSDLALVGRPPEMARLMFTAEEVAARLDPQQWQDVSATTVPREGTLPDGSTATLHDTVLRATRRS